LYTYQCLDYAVFNESWENHLEIDYPNNTDERKIYLLELYAWSKVFLKTSSKLLDLLSINSNFIYVIQLYIHCIVLFHWHILLKKKYSIHNYL